MYPIPKSCPYGQDSNSRDLSQRLIRLLAEKIQRIKMQRNTKIQSF